MTYRNIARLLLAGFLALAARTAGAQDSKLTIGGTTYTKWLWGNQRNQGAMYNYTGIDNEAYGDNGQATELELLLDAKLSRQVEVKSRIHSRFNQNQWTNFGGFGYPRGGGTFDPANVCASGDCGEYDPRSNQYVKLRGVQVILTPGYRWIDSATIGANDFGQFDPFVIGRIRYIDRDNGSGLLFQGSALNRRVTWDAVRISLPRLWAGPGYSTGAWHASDAAYGAQLKYTFSEQVDLAAIGDFVWDNEIDPNDLRFDNGRQLDSRYRNGVAGGRAGVHLGPLADLRAAAYYSYSRSYDPAGLDYGGIAGFGPVSLGKREDWSGKIDWVAADPLGIGLSLNVQGFWIGADYNSIMAARRESDVLLTEGYDATWAAPGPANDRFRAYWRYRFGNQDAHLTNRSIVGDIGYAGWTGNAQQVPTVNVDNAFTDFDEPLAESATGWRGVTANPVWSRGPLEVSGEYTFIGYDTNWQAYGHPERSLNQTPYPGMELDSGVLHNYRSNFSPFQDKWTQIAVLKAKYTVDLGRGVDVFGKVKHIREKDKRMNEDRYLPYEADGTVREYSPGNSTSSVYSDPPTVTGEALDGTVISGPQWKPFRSLSDDDRDLKYWSFNLGAGYQLSDELYVSLTYAKYLADLVDGNTAFQAYRGEHPMVSGDHDKNQFIVNAKYILAGIEFGLEGQYNFGSYEPDFGQVCSASGQADCFVIQRVETQQQAEIVGFPVGTRGFFSRNGGANATGGIDGNPVFNPIDKRDFTAWRLKAFMKAQF